MSHRLIVVTSIVGVMVISWCLSQVTTAQDKPADKGTLVINLTSGKEDLHKATMALQLAGHGLADGKKVVVFLNVRGTQWAARTVPGDNVFAKNPPVPEMLADLAKRGAVVMVCPHCLEAMGMKAEDLAQGCQVASRESLFGSLGSNAAVFSY